MTSKEALNILYCMACIEAGFKPELITYAKEIEHNEKVKEKFDLIKQDLERLEQLKSDNVLQQTQIESLKHEYDILKFNLEEKVEVIADLEKENQDLKEKYTDLSNKEQLMTAYYKDYKKAIELIKNIFGLKVVFRINNNGGYLDFLPEYLIENDLTKEQCELLKEVLE